MKNEEQEKQLFDYVLVVSLKNEGGVPKPYISYRFPPASESKKDNLADAIVQFCFPEAELWMNSKHAEEKKNASETFSFVLTEQDGGRKFGYCRRMVAEGQKKGELIPECYCIISFLPSFPLFLKMLNIVEKLRTERSASAVFSFLKTTLAKSFPKPGEKLVVRTFEGDTHEMQRSDKDFLLDLVSFNTLFKNKIGNILDVFTSLLLESRVIIVSKSVSTLSSCVFALSGLVYPFTWQHVYIPILPRSLMTYCCAPMPFFVGVLKSNLSELNTYPIEEVVMYDVDEDKFLREKPPTASYKLLPTLFGTQLKRTLKIVSKSNQSAHSIDMAISQAFLKFFYSVFEDHENFLVNNKFNRNDFYAAKSKEVKKFLDQFSGSQMYEMFLKDLEVLSSTGTLADFPISKTKFADLNLKTNETYDQEKGALRCSQCNEEIISGGYEKKEIIICDKCYGELKSSKRDKWTSIDNDDEPEKKKDGIKKRGLTVIASGKSFLTSFLSMREKSEKSPNSSSEDMNNSVLAVSSPDSSPSVPRSPKAAPNSNRPNSGVHTAVTNVNKDNNKRLSLTKEITPSSTSPSITVSPAKTGEKSPNSSFVNTSNNTTTTTTPSKTNTNTTTTNNTTTTSFTKSTNKSVLSNSTNTTVTLNNNKVVATSSTEPSKVDITPAIGARTTIHKNLPPPPPTTSTGEVKPLPPPPPGNKTATTAPLPPTPTTTTTTTTGSKSFVNSVDRPAYNSKLLSSSSPALARASVHDRVSGINKTSNVGNSNNAGKVSNFCGTCGNKLENGACANCNKSKSPTSVNTSIVGRFSHTGEVDLCESCKKPFSNEPVTNANGKMFHKQCFLCAACQKPFTDTFALKDNKPYHPDCIKVKCAKCGLALSGKALVAEDKKYHEHCFNCKVCGKSLVSSSYASKDGFTYCKDCALRELDPSRKT